MHLIGWLPPGYDDRQVAQAAAEVSVDIAPLSLFAIEAYARAGILLGYTAVGEQEMRTGLARLAPILRA
jgi:GntR family transcriptional regulator/MocR family aminotransferase